MAYELESEAGDRLRKLYAEMSDGELLDMAARPDELTDTARLVLKSEMASRRLEAAVEVQEPGTRWASDLGGPGSATSSGPEPSPGLATFLGSVPVVGGPDEMDSRPGESYLMVFHDAIQAGQACQALEAAEIWFRLEDISKPEADGMYSAPMVALRVSVRGADHERAVGILRKRMGLFPLAEVTEADADVDDGTVMPVGFFAQREDASSVAAALEEAGIWQRISENPEGSAENEDAWLVEVREVDLMRAGDVVEKALGMG